MLNQWTGIGRLKAKPELAATKTSGVSVCSFTLAVPRDGSKQAGDQEVDWINCTAWGAAAEQITRYFDKGDPIIIKGRLQSRTWEDIHKQTRSSIEVIVDRWYYLMRTRPKTPDVDYEEPAGSTPSRPQASRTAQFTELADDVELPF